MLSFENYCKQCIDNGKLKFNDGWDPVHTPRKVEKPKFVRLGEKVYQEVDGKMIPLHR